MDKLTNNMDKPTNQERMRIFTIWKDREQKMPVSFDEMCRLLWANGLTHTAGYFHYTTIDRFEKMCNGMVPLGEELKLKLFFLSAAEALNDGYESSPALARRLFIGSFTIGVEEEVSMWTNYGVPKRGAIRLRFPRKALNAWKKAYDQNRLRFFGVREKGAEALSKDLVECIDFCDVAYLGRNDARMGGIDRLVYRGETNRLCEDTWRSRLSECLDFAVSMLVDAAKTEADGVALITGDSDQVSAIEAVRYVYGKRVLVFNPHQTFSEHLKRAASYYKNIPRDLPRTCQLPDAIPVGTHGNFIRRPEAWRV